MEEKIIDILHAKYTQYEYYHFRSDHADTAQEIEGLKYKMVLEVLNEWADAPFAGDFDQYVRRKLSQQEQE